MNQIIDLNRCRCIKEVSIKPTTQGRTLEYSYFNYFKDLNYFKDFEDFEELPLKDAYFKDATDFKDLKDLERSEKVDLKTFHIKYEKQLSPIAKLLLKSFKNKYFYYAIDDIFYMLKSNQTERNNLLEILYSMVLSLHNSFKINFFNIWIYEICINEIPKVNKFLTDDSPNFKDFSYITVKFFYTFEIPSVEKEIVW